MMERARELMAPLSWDEETRSMDVVVRGAGAVPFYDAERSRMVDEVHLAEGMIVRGGRDSVVLLDSHEAMGVEHILGRVTRIRAENGVVMGRLELAETPDAERAAQLIRAGHLTDVSMGAVNLEVEHLPEGESREYHGRMYSGPLNVVTRWELIETSLVPVGRDAEARAASRARVRNAETEQDGRERQGQHGGGFAMADQMEKAAKKAAEDEVEKELMEEEEETEAAEDSAEDEEEEKYAKKAAAATATRRLAGVLADARQAERTRILQLRTQARVCGVDDATLEAAINQGRTLAQVQSAWARNLESERGPGAQVVTVGEDRGERALREAAADALLLRAGLVQVRGGRATAQRALMDGGRATTEAVEVPIHEEHGRYAGASLRDLIREVGARNGYRGMGYSTAALQAARTRKLAAGGMSTSDLDAIFENALNKAMGIGFEQAPTTWESWCRTRSVSDLRDNPISKLARHNSLARIGERGEVPHDALTDKKESYRAHLWARRFSITEQMIINDDLSALTTIPARMAAAAQYTVNKFVYWLLMSNPTMQEDSTALFHAAKHKNLATSGDVGAVSWPTMTKVWEAMMLQRGLNGDPLPANFPGVIIVPPAQWGVAHELTTSPFRNDATLANQQTNPYQGLTLAVEPLLASGVTLDIEDGNNLTAAAEPYAWYAAAKPSQADTIEVGFLDGQRTPTLRQEAPIESMAFEYRASMGFGAGVVDYRGLYKNPYTGG